MKKLVILLIVCVVSSVLYAQETIPPSCSGSPDIIAAKIAGPSDTQSQALGLQSFQTENEFNVWFNPAQITVWQTAYGEVWNANPWGGVNTKTPFGYMGVFVGRPYTGNAGGFNTNITGMAVPAITSWQGAALPVATITDDLTPLALTNSNFDILYGRNINDSMAFGARLSMASCVNDQSFKYEAAATPTLGDRSASLKKETSDMEISVGVLMKDLGPFPKVDLAATLSMPKVNDTFSQSVLVFTTDPACYATASDKLTAKNAMNMNILARGSKDIYDNPTLITVGIQMIDVSAEREFLSDNDPRATSQGDTSHTLVAYNDKTTNIMLDAAYETKPADGLKVIYCAGLRSSAEISDVTQSDLNLNQALPNLTGPICSGHGEINSMSLPISVAVEHQTWSKVCTRLGVSKSIYNSQKVSFKNQVYNDDNADNVNETAYQFVSGDQTTVPPAQAPTVTLGLGIVPAKDFSIDLALVTNAYNLNTLISRGSIRYHF